LQLLLKKLTEKSIITMRISHTGPRRKERYGRRKEEAEETEGIPRLIEGKCIACGAPSRAPAPRTPSI
jgi:hypothetical protein